MPSVTGLLEQREVRVWEELESWLEVLGQAHEEVAAATVPAERARVARKELLHALAEEGAGGAATMPVDARAKAGAGPPVWGWGTAGSRSKDAAPSDRCVRVGHRPLRQPRAAGNCCAATRTSAHTPYRRRAIPGTRGDGHDAADNGDRLDNHRDELRQQEVRDLI